MSSRIVSWNRTTPTIGPATYAIGVFDGVHLGHRSLIESAAADGATRGLPCVALTFDRDPDQVVAPNECSPQLLPLEDKCTFLAEAGAAIVFVVPFDTEIASMAPDRFVREVVCASGSPAVIHVGVDFRFGRHAEGTVETLARLGEVLGFSVQPHALLQVHGNPVTSTRIRALVCAGAMSEAADLLGRPHRIRGTVVRGRGEGQASFGIPTANLVPTEHGALPAPGVYAGRARTADGQVWRAAISVGIPPTFPHARHVLEAHLLGFEGDLLGTEIALDFDDRLHSQRRFDNVAELAAAIREDVRRVGESAE